MRKEKRRPRAAPEVREKLACSPTRQPPPFPASTSVVERSETTGKTATIIYATPEGSQNQGTENPSPNIREAAMGSTFLSLHYHIIFATKHRKPSIAHRLAGSAP